ncbi:FecR domain-containing protein [Roseibium sp. FZY0029]|uniref:FecR domain-containing protein n=1 Tax=Roseibium sp. FZY0029 TaxID=3116647 RepID=UPI002E9F31B2|nr:FecR domain-containing protein [Roseibium sp. FZY0029]
MSSRNIVNRANQAGCTAAIAGRAGHFWEIKLRVTASFLLAALAIFWFSQQAFSQDTDADGAHWHWSVERVSGRVMVETREGETFALKRGMTVRKGWKLKTGGGRVVVSRGKETFVVSPNSVVTLEPKGVLIKRMVVYQDRGQVDVDVQRRWYRHFKVETPFLAAVVKGTRFSVRVGNRTASVKVGRGVVGVHDFASGERANVGAGQAAATNPSRRVGLSVSGKTKPEVEAGPKRAPAFQTRVVKNVPASNAQAKAANGISRGNAGIARSGTNGNSGNKGNSGGNGNSGGHGNGNGNGNSGNGNSGGHGNGNGNSGNSNSGGNGNGNGHSGNNSNSGGNSGHGNGNAGGNGNGNGNAGGNGKGKGR